MVSPRTTHPDRRMGTGALIMLKPGGLFRVGATRRSGRFASISEDLNPYGASLTTTDLHCQLWRIPTRCGPEDKEP